MVIVDGYSSIEAQENAVKINEELELSQEELEKQLVEKKQGEFVCIDKEFTYPSGHKRRGFYIDGNLKKNFDNFLIPGVQRKWDAVSLITGIEGSGKSTACMSFAKYLDKDFPGEPLEDGTTRRRCDRIVFTSEQFLEAIDKASAGQCIVFDEAIMGFMAADAATEMQRILIRKMTLIRKKRLYIFIVIPSLFLLRMYMAVFRSKFMIHFYTPDGLKRGFFKFYNSDKKRELYIAGKKDFNQDAAGFNFQGRTTNTEGLFFDVNEYDKKKDDAIASILIDPKKESRKVESFNIIKTRNQRGLLLMYIYDQMKEKDPTLTLKGYSDKLKDLFGDHMQFSIQSLNTSFKEATEFASKPFEDPSRIKPEELVEKMKQAMRKK